MKKNKQVYLILVTWNSEKYLSELFLSLHDLDYPTHCWRLVVVDNGSQDNTLNILSAWKRKMPNFEKIIYNTDNIGFAPANNQALEYALANQADYIALINDDVVTESDWLKKIIQQLDNNQKVGLAQPLITHYPRTDIINSFGNAFQFTGFGYCSRESQPVKKTSLADYEPAYLSFACVVIKSAVFKQIGLLDENYFSYHEDTDFCFRARLAGWQLLALKDAVAHHNYKFPSLKHKIRYFWIEKNRLYLLLKFYRPWTLFLIFPAFIFFEAGLILFSLSHGFLWQRLKAYAWVFKNLPTLLKARFSIQSSRQFGDSELFNFMTGRIDFQPLSNPLLKYIANPLLNFYFKIIKKIIR